MTEQDDPTPQADLDPEAWEGHTPGPWKRVVWGNERYPFPLSVQTEDGAFWIARDGTCSSLANAALIAAAPTLAAEWQREKDRADKAEAEVRRLQRWNAEMVAMLRR